MTISHLAEIRLLIQFPPSLNELTNKRTLTTMFQIPSTQLFEATYKQQAELAVLMQTLPKKSPEFEPDRTYQFALQALLRQDCRIVFCGKTNSGKSTLLNTLIGRPELLPTGDRPLSSQIIEIRNCASEADEKFIILFQDGTEKHFSDVRTLSRYAAEAQDEPGSGPLDETNAPTECGDISLIRLYCHIPHLPKGICLVDTPGFGSVFQDHSDITYLYLEHADAVVYVCQSNEQLQQADQPVLEQIQKRNCNIIVAQTASDLFDEEDNASIAAANKRILQRAYSQAADSPYFILSSTQAIKPQGQQIDGVTNEYDAFRAAWYQLMFRTAGRDVLNQGVASALAYIDENLQLMKQKLLIAQNDASAKELCLTAADKVRLFYTDWMGEGEKIQTLCLRLQEAVEAMTEDAAADMEELKQTVIKQIATLKNDKQAKALSSGLSERINTVWQRVQDKCVARINDELKVLETEVTLPVHSELTKQGVLIPFKLAEFDIRDLIIFMRSCLFATLNALAHNYFGAVRRMGFAIWRLIRRNTAIDRENDLRKQAVTKSITQIFDTMKNSLAANFAKDTGLLNFYYSRAMKQVADITSERYGILVNEAAELYTTAMADQAQKTALIAALSGEKGRIADWERTRNQVMNYLNSTQQ